MQLACNGEVGDERVVDGVVRDGDASTSAAPGRTQLGAQPVVHGQLMAHVATTPVPDDAAALARLLVGHRLTALQHGRTAARHTAVTGQPENRRRRTCPARQHETK